MDGVALDDNFHWKSIVAGHSCIADPSPIVGENKVVENGYLSTGAGFPVNADALGTTIPDLIVLNKRAGVISNTYYSCKIRSSVQQIVFNDRFGVSCIT